MEEQEVKLVVSPEQAELLDVLIEMADAARDVVHAHEHNRPLASRIRRLSKQVQRLEGLIPRCPS